MVKTQVGTNITAGHAKTMMLKAPTQVDLAYSESAIRQYLNERSNREG